MSTPQCPFRQDNSLITRNDGIRSQPPSARTSGHPARATGPFPGKGFPRTPLHRAHPRTTPPPAARSTFYERYSLSLQFTTHFTLMCKSPNAAKTRSAWSGAMRQSAQSASCPPHTSSKKNAPSVRASSGKAVKSTRAMRRSK